MSGKEKTDHDHDDTQLSVGNQAPQPDDDAFSKPRINGGLQAWLTVLALFCVFINSW